MNNRLKNIDIVVTDVSNMGFCSNTFDVVLISLVLHETNENLRKTILREAQRVLRDDGRLIVIEWEQPENIYQKIIFTFIKLLEPKGFKDFLRTDLTSYFQALGFNIINKQSCDYSQIMELIKK